MKKRTANSAGRSSTRVLLADSQALVLEALSALLSTNYLVVGAVTDGLSLVREAIRVVPDLVVSELRLPGLDGIGAARRIRGRCPETRVVLLTSIEDEGLAAETFAAGASGYLLKTSTGAEFVAGLRAVMQGRRTLLGRITKAGGADLLDRARPHKTRAGIGSRAAEVVRLLALGHSMKQAADVLGIAPRTVAFHKYGAMQALGIGSSAELVRFAVEAGLVDAGRRVGAA